MTSYSIAADMIVMSCLSCAHHSQSPCLVPLELVDDYTMRMAGIIRLYRTMASLNMNLGAEAWQVFPLPCWRALYAAYWLESAALMRIRQEIVILGQTGGDVKK